MTSHHAPEFTRPDAHPAKNVRRAGAPNTHQSGENPMVGTGKSLITNDMVPVLGNAAYGTAIHVSMFGLPKQGKSNVAWLVPLVVDEVAAVFAALDEESPQLRAERDAMLARRLREILAGGR